MSAQLGIGTRVALGWFPGANKGVAFKVGRIATGPHEPGFEYTDVHDGRLYQTVYRTWSVDLDEGGTPVLADEKVLLPIDDGDPRAEPLEQEREVSTC